MRWTALLLLLLLALPANAGDREARILCATETANASNIMMMRQNGNSYRHLSGVVQGVSGMDQRMVDEAFQQPAQRSLNAKREVAYLFGQRWGERCRARLGI